MELVWRLPCQPHHALAVAQAGHGCGAAAARQEEAHRALHAALHVRLRGAQGTEGTESEIKMRNK